MQQTVLHTLSSAILQLHPRPASRIYPVANSCAQESSPEVNTLVISQLQRLARQLSGLTNPSIDHQRRQQAQHDGAHEAEPLGHYSNKGCHYACSCSLGGQLEQQG